MHTGCINLMQKPVQRYFTLHMHITLFTLKQKQLRIGFLLFSNFTIKYIRPFVKNFRKIILKMPHKIRNDANRSLRRLYMIRGKMMSKFK